MAATLELAVQHIVYPSSPEKIQEASQFLTQFRKTPEAWQGAWQLLLSTQDASFQLFAAQMLLHIARRGPVSHFKDNYLDQCRSILNIVQRAQDGNLISNLLSCMAAVCCRSCFGNALVAVEQVSAMCSEVWPDVQASQHFTMLFLSAMADELAGKEARIIPQERASAKAVLRSEYQHKVVMLATSSLKLDALTSCILMNSWISHIGIDWETICDFLGSIVTTIGSMPAAADLPTSITDFLFAVTDTYSSDVASIAMIRAVGELAQLSLCPPLFGVFAAACKNAFRVSLLDPAVSTGLQLCVQASLSQNMEIKTQAFDVFSSLADQLDVSMVSSAHPLLCRAGRAICEGTAYPQGFEQASLLLQEAVDACRETGRSTLRQLSQRDPLFTSDLLAQCAALLQQPEALDNVYLCEAVLHSLSAVSSSAFPSLAKAGNEADEHQRRLLLQLFTRLPQHPCVQRMLVLLLGLIAPWLNSHPEYFAAAARVCSAGFTWPQQAPLFPMKFAEDHISAVSLLKLSRCSNAFAILSTIVDVWQMTSRMDLSRSSVQLVVQAVGQVAAVSAPAETCAIIVHASKQLGTCHDESKLAAAIEDMSILLSSCSPFPAEALGVVADLVHGLAPVSGANVSEQLLGLAASVIKLGHEQLAVLALGLCSSHLNVQSAALYKSLQIAYEEHAAAAAVQSQLSQMLPTAVEHGLACIRQLDTSDEDIDYVSAMYDCIAAAIECDSQYMQLLQGACEFIVLGPSCCPAQVRYITNKPGCHAYLSFVSSACSVPSRSPTRIIHALTSRHGPQLAESFVNGITDMFPSASLDTVFKTFVHVWRTCGEQSMLLWLQQCLESPTCVRASVSAAAKVKLLEDLQTHVGKNNMSKAKNALKQFCGGKKKNT